MSARSTPKPAAPAPAPSTPPPAPPEEFSPAEVAALNEEARLYRWRMYSFGELRAMCGINAHVMGAVASHKLSPFKFGKKGRPEWVADFLADPPADFSVK